MHVLAAGVGGVDPPRLRRGVPVVDGVVVLDAGVGALPGRLGELAPQRRSVDALEDLAGLPGPEPELPTALHGAHELVGHPDGVVGVLVLHAGDVTTAEVHVVAGVAQSADLVLLASLGLDELLDIRVVDVKDDHLGGTPSRTPGLDGAGRGVRPAHEGHRTGRCAAGGQQLLAGADAGQVEPRAGTALEDPTLLAVPVEDRVHGVLDGEDEAGAHLLRGRCTDVEPDRGVEAEHLVEQHPGQLVLEGLRIRFGAEVAVVAPRLGVGEHHAVDELAKAALAGVGTDRAPEVLGGDDRGGVDRPEVGELDPPLLEDRLAGLPVRLNDVPGVPGHAVVGVHAGCGPHALDGDAAA